MNAKDLHNYKLLPEHLKKLPPVPEGYTDWKIHGFNNGSVYPSIQTVNSPWNIVLKWTNDLWCSSWCKVNSTRNSIIESSNAAFYIIAVKRRKRTKSKPLKTLLDLQSEIKRLKKDLRSLEKIKKILCENS